MINLLKIHHIITQKRSLVKCLNFYDDYLSFTKEIDQYQERYSRSYLETLVLLNKCRAFVLNQKNDSDYKIYFSFYQVVQDIQREILILPKIYLISFENKITEINNNLQIGGIKGYYTVLSELFIWLILIVFVIFSVRRFDDFQEKMESFLDVLIEQLNKNNQISKWFIYILEILSRSAAWVLIIVSLKILKWLLQHSLFFELELPLNILEIYGYYKVAFFALRYALVKIKSSNALPLSYSKQLRLFKDLFNLLKVFFFSLSVLNVINFVTAQSLLYQFSFWLFSAFIFFYLYYILNQWKIVIYKDFSDKTSHLFLSVLHKSLRTKILSVLVVPFLAIGWLIFSVTSMFYHYLQRFEWMKKISAKLLIFKVRRTVSFEEKRIDERLPDDYKNQILLHDDIPSAMFVETSEYFEMRDYIDEWLKKESLAGDSLVLKGYYGAGKTTLLQKIKDDYEKNVPVIYINLATVFNGNAQQDSLQHILKDLDFEQRYIVVMDNFQKCFIQTQQRKEFLSELISYIVEFNHNILFCFSCESVSWDHMNHIQMLESYFSKIITLSKFSYDELKLLVEKRHKRTAYQISFAEIALKDGKMTSVRNDEDRSFDKLMKVIWQQSRKNLYLALQLWCDCLSLDQENVLIAHYPKPLTLFDYKEMDLETLFILAAFLRYASLTFEEVCFCLENSYPKELVIVKVKALAEQKILQKQEHSFFINPVYYWSLLKYLEVKGYVT